MLDLAAGLLPQARPGLLAIELSWCDGHDRCSGEAEAARRSDAAATARLSGGVAEGAKGPLGGRWAQRLRIDTTGPGNETLRPQPHRSDICPDLRGFLLLGPHNLGLTPQALCWRPFRAARTRCHRGL
jgi:hypothetical protein